MPRLRAWISRIVGLLTPSKRERELAEEIDSLVQLHVDHERSVGRPAQEARREALIAFGSREAFKDSYRDAWGIPFVDRVITDFKHAVRYLRTGVNLAAIVMLALAIGITTAMFTLVNALLLRPVPFPHPDRLAHLHMWTEHGGKTGVSPTIMDAWRASSALEAIEGTATSTAVLDVNGQPVVASTAFATPGLFDMLGAVPIRGRVPAATESAATRGNQILISESLWRSAFGADSNIVGRAVRLDASTVVIVGVLPRWFHYPDADSTVWRPLPASAFNDIAGSDPVPVVRFSATLPRATALKMATDAAHAANPSTARLQARTTNLVTVMFEDQYYQDALPVLAAGVTFVFLALCSNVTSLLLTRFTARRREFAVCAALGASRGRIVQRAFAEAATVSLLGIVGGIGLAAIMVRIARLLLPAKMLAATLAPLTIDARALTVAILLGVTATLVAGLLPTLVSVRSLGATSGTLVERVATESRAARAITCALLIAEMALATTLLTGSTLLVRSFINISRIDRGFDPTGRVGVSIWFDRSVQGRPVRSAIAERAENELRSLPSVQRVVWSSGGPMVSGNLYFYDWHTDQAGASPVHLNIDSVHVGPDFFDIYDIPFIRGRTFEPNEPSENVVIGERLATTLWPNSDPIGHTFGATGDLHFRVIGVVKEIRRALIEQPHVQLYEPRSLDSYGGLLSLKCATRCPSEGVIRQRLLSAVPGIQVFHVTPMEETYLADLAQPRASAALALVFAAMALLAAAGGLFGVLNHAVARRKREFGIRVALGASMRALRMLVLKDGFRIVLIGGCIGLVGAWAAARGLSAVQFGVTVSDPLSWAIVLGILAASAMSACWQPARAATRVDPAILLRDE
jgi:predicted permease